MSALPAAAISTGIQQVSVMNPLDVLMTSINTNPYFIGLMMLLLNLGGRFLSLEISKDQEKFLSQPVVRRFFLFAVLFVATRNLIIAGGLTILMIIVIGYLFNENSSLCLWKTHTQTAAERKEKEEEDAKGPKVEGFIGLSPEEALILKRLQDKQMAAAQAAAQSGQPDESKDTLGEKVKTAASDLYQSALISLRSFYQQNMDYKHESYYDPY